jgi:hypothetical protein
LAHHAAAAREQRDHEAGQISVECRDLSVYDAAFGINDEEVA